MDKDTIKNFQNIIGKFASAKIMTKDDIEQILKGVLTIMNTFKKGNETLNTETTNKVEELYAQVKTLQAEIQATNTKNSQKLKDDLNSKTDKQLEEMRSLFNDFLLLKPEDGKDADPQEILQAVLENINLPEPVELDTGAQIIEKINKEKDFKIDASHIANLPKFTREIIREVGAHGGAYETPLVDSTGKAIPKNAQGAYVIPSSTPSSANIVFGEIVLGDVNTFTLAHTPSGTISLAANGQVLTLAVDYTISGAIITTLSPWSAGTVVADYQY